MAKKQNDLFFINIPGPKLIRRNLLESSQQMVSGMKSYEKYKRIKADKLKHLDELKKSTAQIKELAGQLRACLPTIRGTPVTATEKALPHVAEIELEQLNKEIRKLEEELHMIK
jgi:hypothetical protein